MCFLYQKRSILPQLLWNHFFQNFLIVLTGPTFARHFLVLNSIKALQYTFVIQEEGSRVTTFSDQTIGCVVIVYVVRHKHWGGRWRHKQNWIGGRRQIETVRETPHFIPGKYDYSNTFFLTNFAKYWVDLVVILVELNITYTCSFHLCTLMCIVYNTCTVVSIKMGLFRVVKHPDWSVRRWKGASAPKGVATPRARVRARLLFCQLAECPSGFIFPSM